MRGTGVLLELRPLSTALRFLRCRRFAFGAFKNPSFRSLRGYGVEVSFKKWAKIEAFGDTVVHPVATVLRWERMVEAGAPVANLVGRLVKSATGKRAWAEATYIATEKLTRRLNARGSNGPQAEAFLLEVYNPTGSEIRLQVIFAVSADDVTCNGSSRRWWRRRSIRLRCRPVIRAVSFRRSPSAKSSIAGCRSKSRWCPRPTETGGWFSLAPIW